MDKNKIKISACILTKNDDKFIKDCVDNVSKYVDEIVLLDANDNDLTAEIISGIKKSSSIPIIYRKTEVSYDFSKDRNELQSLASGDYVLHIDCDEKFDTTFLQKMKYIIQEYLNNGTLPILFRFPRINQPDKVNYPDYQIRLINRKYTKWKKRVHEVPYIMHMSENALKEIDMNIANMVTLEYPITHLYKDKTKLQIRWNDMLKDDHSYKRKKLLVLSIFKDSELWINDTLKCMNNFYQYNDDTCEDMSKLNINFSFIDGGSTDNTFEILENYCKQGNILDIQLRQFEHMNYGEKINDLVAKFRRLAIVRNYAIEQSVSHFNLEDNDYILFVDSDIKFQENIVHKLIIEMENCGADIIAPMIYIENFREFGNNYFYDTLAFRYIDGSKFDHNIKVDDKNVDNYKEIGSVGSFYLMKYKVAKSVKYSGEKDSEQVEFCNNARSLGFKIFVSPRLSVLHINLDKYGLK